MKTDIQIAQEAQMEHIKDVAARAGIIEEELEFYGKYKAKLSGSGSRTGMTGNSCLSQLSTQHLQEKGRRQLR